VADDQHFPFKRLEAYLEQTLPAAEQARWAAHLQSCAGCQARMATELAFIDQLRQATGAPHALTPRQSATIRQNLNRRLRRSMIMRKMNTAVSYAVGLLLFVAAITLFIWWQQDDLEIGATEVIVAETATPEIVATETAVSPIPFASPTMMMPDFPRPTADAMLICQDTVGQSGLSLWHFSASPPRWDRRSARFLNTPGFIAQGIIPLPGSEAILVYGVKVAEDSSAGFQIYLWQARSERLVVDASQPYTILALTAGRLRKSGYLYAVPADNPQQLVRLNVAQCLSGDCEFEPTDRILFDNPQSGPALEWHLQSDGESLVTVPGLFSDAGVAPFWLDETTFGYLSAVDGLILRQINEPAEFVSLLDEAQAKALLLAYGLITETDNIILAGARGTPTHPNIVLASAINFDDMARAFLFVIDRQTGDVRYIPAITAPRLTELAMSPGGNYLVIPTGNQLQLYALGTGEIITYPHRVQTMGIQSYAFTADDQWLLLLGEIVTMVQLTGEFALERVMDGQRCILGAWLDSP
jgi:hypothetical protein